MSVNFGLCGTGNTGALPNRMWEPRFLSFDSAIFSCLGTCHFYLTEQERGSIGTTLEMFMDKIENGVYHFLPHSFGQNSVVYDVTSSSCKGGWK